MSESSGSSSSRRQQRARGFRTFGMPLRVQARGGATPVCDVRCCLAGSAGVDDEGVPRGVDDFGNGFPNMSGISLVVCDPGMQVHVVSSVLMTKRTAQGALQWETAFRRGRMVRALPRCIRAGQWASQPWFRRIRHLARQEPLWIRGTFHHDRDAGLACDQPQPLTFPPISRLRSQHEIPGKGRDQSYRLGRKDIDVPRPAPHQAGRCE
jgi:hypothetical protein